MQFSEQWEALRPRLDRFRTWLGTPERTHPLLLLLWPFVALVITVLVIRRASTGKELADLISALASLAWSLVPFAIIVWFGREIRIIALRIRKGKILGQEFELLDELQAKTEVAEATSSKIASATGTASGTGSATAEGAGAIGEESVLDAIEEVLQEASRSPRLGLILLDAKIERALREQPRLAAYRPPGEPPVFLPELRREVFEALTSFKQVRNRIVHGGDAGDDEVARAIDSGTRLLRLLLSRPRPPAEPDDG